MKALQNLLTLVLVVGLVFGVAYVWQKYFVGKTDPAQAPTTATAGMVGNVLALSFPDPIAEWPGVSGQTEIGTTGHYDFWFSNPHASPMKLGVEHQSCKCSKLEVASFPSDKRERYHRWQVASGAGQILEGQRGLLPLLAQTLAGDTVARDRLDARIDWQVVHMEDRSKQGATVMIEPQTVGIVRVSWEPKKVGDERLAATLWAQAQPATSVLRGYQRLEVPVTNVHAFIIDPQRLLVEDLNAGEKKRLGFACWSATRAAFDLSAVVLDRDKKPDPCFRCIWHELSDDERDQLAARTKTRALFGYQVTVEISERTENKQLDLGPLRRQVTLHSDPGIEPNGPLLEGQVRGEVSVGTGEERDIVKLGSFPANQGTKKELPLTTEGVELLTNTIHREPEYLKVELIKDADGGGATWTLKVEVPPNVAAGPVSGQIEIDVKKAAGPARRVRIPVGGTAYFN